MRSTAQRFKICLPSAQTKSRLRLWSSCSEKYLNGGWYKLTLTLEITGFEGTVAVMILSCSMTLARYANFQRGILLLSQNWYELHWSPMLKKFV